MANEINQLAMPARLDNGAIANAKYTVVRKAENICIGSF